MLYERWLAIARDHRSERALEDPTSGRRWSFHDLQAEAERSDSAVDSVMFPQGMSAEFILDVLRAWRSNAVLCPLEEGQSGSPLTNLPMGCSHLKTTSASTGLPRLIAFTPEQLMADADQIVATMGLRPEWPNLAVISLAHSYGFSNLVLPLLLHGIPLILARSPLPESVRRAATLVSGVTLPAVPALWRTWLDAECIPPNVRLAISAGASLPVNLELDVHTRCGLKIHNFYGASECGGIAYDNSLIPRTDSSEVGCPMHQVDISLNDEGCLQVRSRAAGLTYWPEPLSTLGRGCYQSSDLAQLVNGRVFLAGRKTDQINVAGRKVSPETIECILAAHPNVRDCLVFGAPSPDLDRGEMIVACVATKSAPDAAELKRHLLAQLPGWQIPRDWWFVPQLEINGRGKLARHAWQQKYLNRSK